MSYVDIQNIETIEFGVCLSNEGGDSFFLVPVDVRVKDALQQMLRDTADEIGCFVTAADLPAYEPAEKYASTEKLRYPIQDDDLSTAAVILFNAQNLPTDQNALRNPSEIVFYFALFRDRDRRKVLGIRRAVQFKGVLKAKGRLIRWLDDTMKVVEDDVFRLDQDFDYLVTDDEMYILRPSGFEYTVHLDQRILAKAAENAQELQKVIPFLALESLAHYVSTHKRAARLVAAIRSRNDLDRMTKGRLKAECHQTGVQTKEVDGKLQPVDGQELQFLMLLDRRRYSVLLIADNPETYEAASRRQVQR